MEVQRVYSVIMPRSRRGSVADLLTDCDLYFSPTFVLLAAACAALLAGRLVRADLSRIARPESPRHCTCQVMEFWICGIALACLFSSENLQRRLVYWLVPMSVLLPLGTPTPQVAGKSRRTAFVLAYALATLYAAGMLWKLIAGWCEYAAKTRAHCASASVWLICAVLAASCAAVLLVLAHHFGLLRKRPALPFLAWAAAYAMAALLTMGTCLARPSYSMRSARKALGEVHAQGDVMYYHEAGGRMGFSLCMGNRGIPVMAPLTDQRHEIPIELPQGLALRSVYRRIQCRKIWHWPAPSPTTTVDASLLDRPPLCFRLIPNPWGVHSWVVEIIVFKRSADIRVIRVAPSGAAPQD